MKRFSVYAAGLATALFFAIPGLSHDYWHDEIYTLLNFASHWVLALFDYHLPNNHQLFSLLLYWWLKIIPVNLWVYPLALRILPLFFFIGTTCFLGYLTAKSAGRRAAILTVTIFASSHIALGFATELRGYSLSWLTALGALASLRAWLIRPAEKYLRYYAAATIAAVGIIPTNLLIPLALVPWFLWELAARDGWKTVWRKNRRTLLTVIFSPFAGLIFLLPNYPQLTESIAGGSAFPRLMFLWHYPCTVFLDLLPLSPVLLLLWLPALKKARVFLFSVFIAPYACTALLPRVPNDRTLVVLWPLIVFGCGLAAKRGFSLMARQRAPSVFRAWVFMIICGLLWGFHREKPEIFFSPRTVCHDDKTYDLQTQYFNCPNFRPAAVIRTLAQISAAQSPLIIFADEDYLLIAHCMKSPFSPIPIKTTAVGVTAWQTDSRILEKARKAVRNSPVIIVARNSQEALAVAEKVNLTELNLYQKCGHLRIFTHSIK